MSSEIKLPENLTIHHIENHFNSLNTQFNEAEDDINLEASAVEAIDTAGLQALLVLIKSASENSKTITWQNTPEVIISGAEKLGIKTPLLLS